MIAMRMTVAPLVLSLALAATGCNEKNERAVGKSTTTSAAASASASAPALRDASGKLTKAGVDAAWNAAFLGSAYEPIDARIATFEAKVGAPATVENGKKVWFTVDGTKCFRVELSKGGTKGAEMVAASSCGL